MKKNPSNEVIERCLKRVRKASMLHRATEINLKEKMLEARREGATLREIAKECGISHESVRRILEPEIRLKY